MVVGPRRWIFTAANRAIDAYRGELQLSPPELAWWKRALEDRRAWLEAHGSRYLFVIVPEKTWVYPEELPAGIRPQRPGPLDQILACLAGSESEPLDLRAPLLAAKPGDRDGDWLYYRYGTHWTERGAHVGSIEILRRLQRWLPDLRPLPASDFERVPRAGQGDTMAGTLSLADLLPQSDVAFRSREPAVSHPAPDSERGSLGIREIDDPRLPSCLFLHDSTGAALWPFLTEHFRRIRSQERLDLDLDAVLEEHPDVVIQVIAERRLPAYRPSRTPLEAADAGRLAFESAAAGAFRLDAPGAAARLSPWQGAKLGVGRTPDEPPLTLRCRSPADGLLLPELQLPAGNLPVLRIDLEAPKETDLTLLYQTSKRRKYIPMTSVHAHLRPGRNLLHLVVRAPDVTGRLLLLPGARGRYTLQALEVRVVPAPE